MPNPSKDYATIQTLGYEYNPPVAQNKETARIMQNIYAGIGGHYGYPRFPINRDIGGPLNILSQKWSATHWKHGTAWRANNWFYTGNFIASSPGFPTQISGDGAAWGAQAYDKLKPTKPNFQALNAIYELRELPQLFKLNLERNFLHFQSDYFLAIQFGWEPLLRDIRNFVHLQRRAQKSLKWLIEHNTKPVRRKKILLDTSADVSDISGSSYSVINPTFVTQYYRKIPTYRDVTRSHDRIWASARFRYWLPEGPRDIDWTNKMLGRLYGHRVTPSVIYNMIPWSWLIDWFTNLGDVISNMDLGVADRLAADYFYVMREISTIRERTAYGYFYSDSTLRPFDFVVASSAQSINKTRLRGDPFGLSTNENDLNGMQIAILGALGLSRIR